MANKNFLSDHGFKLFLILAFAIVAFGYFYPLLKYPYENSNPWPEAYQVIQKSIIEQQKVPPDNIVQFGEKQPSDMVYFLNQHLALVDFKLISGQSFDINERFLSVILTLVIFLSAYLFFNKIFGTTRGFLASVLFIFLPRNFNYYTNVNGEFLSLIILFVSLYFIFDWLQNRNVKNLMVGTALAGILPILCLINFAVLLLTIFAYFVAEMFLNYDRRPIVSGYLKLTCWLAGFTVILAVSPLIVTGNVHSGASSSIGSLYAKRSQAEIEFEKKYYNEFAFYGNDYLKIPPLARDFYYMSLEGSRIDHLIIYFIFPFFLGLMLIWRQRHRREVLLSFFLAIELILLEILLYSRFFNENIYNSALRFLIYFSLPVVMLGSIALEYFNKKNRTLIWIFILSLAISSYAIVDFSAHSSNMYLALYARPYKETLAFAKDNIPSDAIIMSNDWTNGQFYVVANKLDITESGKASAGYSTYEHIYGILADARLILNPLTSAEKTRELLKNREIKYVVIWNRPDAYLIYQYVEAEKKFSSLPFAEKVYSGSEMLDNGFFASATVYRIKTSQL